MLWLKVYQRPVQHLVIKFYIWYLYSSTFHLTKHQAPWSQSCFSCCFLISTTVCNPPLAHWWWCISSTLGMGAVEETIIFSGCAKYISPWDLGPLVMLKSDIHIYIYDIYATGLVFATNEFEDFWKEGIHRWLPFPKLAVRPWKWMVRRWSCPFGGCFA